MLNVTPPTITTEVAAAVYAPAWRFDFDAPGFALLDLGTALDSHALRAAILDLGELQKRVAEKGSGVD